MTAEGVAGLLDILSRVSALTASLLVIYGLLTERILPRGRLDEMRRERDALRESLARRLDALEAAIRRVDDTVARK